MRFLNGLSIPDGRGEIRALDAALNAQAKLSASGRHLPVGAGGMVLGVQVAPSGRQVCWTDVGNGWLRDPGQRWRPLMTSRLGVFQPGKSGAAGLAVAPSNPDIVYLAAFDRLFTSTDAGVSWVSSMSAACEANGETRMVGPRVSVDPANPLHAYYGTLKDGLWRTTDGTNWAKVTGLPTPVLASWTTGGGFGGYRAAMWTDAGTNYAGWGVIAPVFDPSAALVGGRTGSLTVSIQGRGLYRSTDGGDTWAVMPNQPFALTAESMSYATDGTLYVTAARQAWRVNVTATGGTYTITVGGQTTAAIAYNKGAWDGVQTALDALPAPYGSGGIVASDTRGGDKYMLQSRVGANVTITLNTGSLTGGSASIADMTYADWGGLGTCWRITSAGVWTHVPVRANQRSGSRVAADPHTPGRVLVMESGFSDGSSARLVHVSKDSGATWQAPTVQVVTPGEIPWVTKLYNPGSGALVANQVVFDPTTKDIAWFVSGNAGCWRMALDVTGTPGTATCEVRSSGIEELVTPDVVAIPGAGAVMATWDCKLLKVTGQDYADHQTPDSLFGSAWSIGQDPNNRSSLVASLANHQDGGGLTQSGYSVDGGATWTPFPTLPLGATNAYDTFGFGQIVISGSNVIWLSSNGKGCHRSANKGTSWSAVTLPGGVDPGTANTRSQWVYRRPLTVDVSGAFFLFVEGQGVYRSTDGGATWTLRCTAASMPSGDFGWHIKLKAAPNGTLWLVTGGTADATGEITTNVVLRSSDAGATWATVAGLTSVRELGFGAGGDILADGYWQGQRGMIYSSDAGATWNRVADYPAGILAQCLAIDGDKTIPGRFYCATDGTGTIRMDVGRRYGADVRITASPPLTDLTTDTVWIDALTGASRSWDGFAWAGTGS